MDAAPLPPSPPRSDRLRLPDRVEEMIESIRRDQSLSPPDHKARWELARLGEEAALKILRQISASRIKNFSAYIMHMAKNSEVALALNAEGLCTQESACFSGPRNPNFASNRDNSTGISSSCEMPQCELFPRQSTSPIIMALGGLEFRKTFMILSYAGRKLEEVISVDLIEKLKCLPIVSFELELWKATGPVAILESERRKNLDWNSTKTHVYHCHVNPQGDLTFKGPYLQDTKTHLQRVLGDDNVLLVKFAEETNGGKRLVNLDSYNRVYHRIAKDGISVGLRRYKFFVFKDGGKEKKKSPTSSTVKCYFVRTESSWAMDENKPYILCNKSIHEARCIFMHVHTVSSVAKYMARFSLILSKTKKLDVDLSFVDIKPIEDIPCMEDGRIVYNEDGEPMIHTDGTGYISEDLAMQCAKDIEGRNLITGDIGPLLIQFRLFNNGDAVKGTLLLNKRLPPKTIRIRPKMIKVERDPKISNIQSCNSLEIVGTSNQPKGTTLSRSLIALLHYGGVPKEYFLELLINALDDAQNGRCSTKAALRVALRYGEMDDSLAARMISCGIPLNEPFLQYQLSVLMKEELKGLKEGKIPMSECYYLMGTADPTGSLGPKEVCVILGNGQISGEVLVYKHPGLHFGDIHLLTATYVKDMEKIVGNAKFGIFFPVTGPRSLADEMANSDFDGDLYWISRNPQLLEHYKASKPWVHPNSKQKSSQLKPIEFSSMELEYKLFQQFLNNRFKPSYAMSVASTCWMAFMDRLLTLGDECAAEKECLVGKILQLVDIYYDALDAPKSGIKVEVPDELKAECYPHYLERSNSSNYYHSTSILGFIYDKVDSFQKEDQASSEIRQLPCFSEAAPQACLKLWKERYDKYREEMTQALRLEVKESKDLAAEEVIQKYKLMLYGAAKFENSPRKQEDIFDEALAIYQVVYDYAQIIKRCGLCGFAWKVAGPALCKLYEKKQGEDMIVCSRSVLREILG